MKNFFISIMLVGSVTSLSAFDYGFTSPKALLDPVVFNSMANRVGQQRPASW